MKFIAIENHPNDSRVKIREDGICQSLTGRMGTGGATSQSYSYLSKVKTSQKRHRL